MLSGNRRVAGLVAVVIRSLHGQAVALAKSGLQARDYMCGSLSCTWADSHGDSFQGFYL